MIARLRGKLVSASPCVVDVGGVGYELAIPEKDRERLRPDDAPVEFHTFVQVRDDRMVLFGFLDREDRALFTRLIDVSGIGPKLALSVLSLHPAERVVEAIRGGDAGFLRQLPGLGRKTADRLVMELGDKLDDLVAGRARAPAGASALRDEVVAALASLGMTRAAAEAALDKMNWRPDPQQSVADVVREALRYAGK